MVICFNQISNNCEANCPSAPWNEAHYLEKIVILSWYQSKLPQKDSKSTVSSVKRKKKSYLKKIANAYYLK